MRIVNKQRCLTLNRVSLSALIIAAFIAIVGSASNNFNMTDGNATINLTNKSLNGLSNESLPTKISIFQRNESSIKMPIRIIVFNDTSDTQSLTIPIPKVYIKPAKPEMKRTCSPCQKRKSDN